MTDKDKLWVISNGLLPMKTTDRTTKQIVVEKELEIYPALVIPEALRGKEQPEPEHLEECRCSKCHLKWQRKLDDLVRSSEEALGGRIDVISGK